MNILRYKFAFVNGTGFIQFYEFHKVSDGVDTIIHKSIPICYAIESFNDKVNELQHHPLVRFVDSLQYMPRRKYNSKKIQDKVNLFK